MLPVVENDKLRRRVGEIARVSRRLLTSGWPRNGKRGDGSGSAGGFARNRRSPLEIWLGLPKQSPKPERGNAIPGRKPCEI